MLTLTGRCYGAQIPAKIAAEVARKGRRWEWVSCMGGRSITECEIVSALRCIYAEDDAATRRCLIYARVDDPAGSEAAGATGGAVTESENAQLRQAQVLIDDLRLRSHRAQHLCVYVC
jgi:hypothetical protein